MKKNREKIKHLTNFEEVILKVVEKIPTGRVTTYSSIANAVNRPKAVRAVGNALHKNFWTPKTPCHRVVKSNGSIGGYAGGVKEKIKLLRIEGVKVRKNKVVDFKKIKH